MTNTRYSIQDPDELVLIDGLPAQDRGMLGSVTMPQGFGVLQFAGGPVAIPKPTRADLLLSAKQWATAGRERAGENGCCDHRCCADLLYIIHCYDRVMKAIVEAEAG